MKKRKSRPTAKSEPEKTKKDAADELPLNPSDYAVAQLGAHTVKRRPIRPYVPPPGVVPEGAVSMAHDAGPTTNGQNFYGWLNSQFCGVGFPGYAYLSELAQRSEYRAPSETISKEMTRKFVKFVSKSKDPKAADKIKKLEAAFKKHDVRQVWRDTLQKDLFFGRCQIYIDIEGSDDPEVKKQPLTIDPKTIKKGSLRGFKVIEPIWTTPLSYNSIDATAPDFYKPVAWYVNGTEVHHTRLITVVSRPVPDILKPAYNFGGISLTQLMEPYVLRWLKTVSSVNQLISNFSTMILKTVIQGILQGKTVDASGLMKRAQMYVATRDNQGLQLIDKNTEEMESVNVPISGLAELQAQAQEHMAAPSHVPLVKLTGITPAGLNASSEGEITVFHEFVGSEQENSIEPGLDVMFDAIQCDEFGAIDEDLDYEFVPLVETTQKEVAETRKADGDRMGNLINAGVIDADEAREALRMDPDSGFSHLSGDAPGMPTDPNLIDPETGESRAPAPGEDPDEDKGPPGAKDSLPSAIRRFLSWFGY